jgi:hypothetical protein
MGILVVVVVVVLVCQYAHSAVSGDSIGDVLLLCLSKIQPLCMAIL